MPKTKDNHVVLKIFKNIFVKSVYTENFLDSLSTSTTVHVVAKNLSPNS